MTEYLPQILGFCGTILSVGLLQWYYNRKATRRLAEAQARLADAQAQLAETQNNSEEWHIYKEQLEAEREHVRFKDERITELLKMNQEKENRFIEQTQRLRDTQARELEANEKLIAAKTEIAEVNAHNAELERENGELKLRLKEYECIKIDCIHRDPPNEHTKRAIAALHKSQQAKTDKHNENTN